MAGLKCPVCFGKTILKYTEPYGTFNRKRRACVCCGFKFWCSETIDPDELKKAERLKNNATKDNGRSETCQKIS